MELKGERLIPASREEVWQGLNDPDVLKSAIPGCESLDRVSDSELTAVVRVKVGPVNARFRGKVILSNVDQPNSYTLTGEGQGGAAGFARGSADVELKDETEGTLLSYTVTAMVGGKLAQVGSRLIEGTSRKLSDQFFDAFAGILSGEVPAAIEEVAAEAEVEPAAPERPAGLPMALWILLLILFVAGLLFLFSG